MLSTYNLSRESLIRRRQTSSVPSVIVGLTDKLVIAHADRSIRDSKALGFHPSAVGDVGDVDDKEIEAEEE